jgi:hypothetical protein
MSTPVRFVLAVTAALLAWFIVATLINFGLRAAIYQYPAQEASMSFSLGSELARLGLGLVATAAGAIVAMLASRGILATAIVAGCLLLLLFLPVHVHIWSRFPVWYHLFFLASLPVVSYAAARWWVCRSRPSGAH